MEAVNEPDYKEAARKLWALLDDIDTLDDACRADDAAFRKHARDAQRKRFQILSGERFDALAASAALQQQEAGSLSDGFNGDTPHLIRCIEALLNLDADGALVPHGIPGHARTLLTAAAVRLACAPSPTEPKAAEGVAPADGWVEAGLVCQACAGDAPRGKCLNPRCIGGPIVRELVPASGVAGHQNSCSNSSSTSVDTPGVAIPQTKQESRDA